MITERCCKNCKFFDKAGRQSDDGFCRAEPPQNVDDEGKGLFPLVNELNFCGFHAKKKEEE